MHFRNLPCGSSGEQKGAVVQSEAGRTMAAGGGRRARRECEPGSRAARGARAGEVEIRSGVRASRQASCVAAGWIAKVPEDAEQAQQAHEKGPPADVKQGRMLDLSVKQHRRENCRRGRAHTSSQRQSLSALGGQQSQRRRTKMVQVVDGRVAGAMHARDGP